MPKLITLSLLTAVLFAIVTSCSTEPAFNLKMEKTMVIDEGEGGFANFIVSCPTEGNNCRIQNGCLEESQRVILDSFYAAYKRDDLNQFFDNYDWKSLFPDLDLNHAILQGIKDGVNRVWVAADSSILITSTKDSSFTDNQILTGYKRSPCH